MYSLFINPENQLPTYVSQRSRHYAELTYKGHKEVMQGTKKKIETKQRELLEELNLNDLDIITEDN